MAKKKLYDRYELAAINRDELRKMLTQMRQEESRIEKLLNAAQVDSVFNDGFNTRAKRREINNKQRTINEYLRIQKSLENAGKDGGRIIKADQHLAAYFDRRNAENLAARNDRFIVNTPANRKAFGEFMQAFKASVIGKTVYSGDAVDFFEEHGANSDIDEMISLYEDDV